MGYLEEQIKNQKEYIENAKKDLEMTREISSGLRLLSDAFKNFARAMEISEDHPRMQIKSAEDRIKQLELEIAEHKKTND